MYFKSRVQAGQELAAKLMKRYRTDNCVVMTLSPGGFVVGAEIAKKLHCSLTLLLTEQIKLPGEPVPVASISQDGGYTENQMYSSGQLKEFNSEYYHYIEQEKMNKLRSMNRLLGKGGDINRDLLRRRSVIIVADGLGSAYSLDAALDFLKPISIKKLVVATPISSLHAISRMHVEADELYCISVTENYISTDHYYDDNNLPDRDTIMKMLETITLHWE